MPETITRNDAYSSLAKAAIYGNLGLFIGAGFSKAVLAAPGGATALSWPELIVAASRSMGLNFEDAARIGSSYPDIATSLCLKYSEVNKTTYASAVSELKGAIANLTSWYPDAESRREFSDYLNDIDPAWIITTNYDLIIESLLTGRCNSLGPHDRLTSPKGIVPVFHLHGLRTNPTSIIITQEDYVALFRPNVYRQVKLALTIRESTTLILGYGLGDVNVLTAVDWSRNVYAQREALTYPHDIVQVVRRENPRREPYRDRHDVLILETAELSHFLAEFTEILALERDFRDHELEGVKKYRGELEDPSPQDIADFIDNEVSRKEMLSRLATYERHLISGFLNFFTRCIDETWERAKPSGAFHAYNENLRICLDILTAFEVAKMPPALFQVVAYSLDRVLAYVGKVQGQSWQAADTWDVRKRELTQETLGELYAIAYQSKYARLWSELRELFPEKSKEHHLF